MWTSLRMTAPRAAFLALPAFTRRSYKALASGLYYVATMAGM